MELILITSHSIINSILFKKIKEIKKKLILTVINENLINFLNIEKIFIIYITYIKVSYWSYEKDFYL